MKKEFTLRLDDAACAELENLKKNYLVKKTDAKAIRFAIQNYATLNDRYIETQRQIRTWKDKYAALNKAVDDYLSSFEALKKTTD
jgi:hypothetical protein